MIGIRPHLGIQLRELFDLKFVINGKVVSLHKVIKYVKRSKSSSDDFNAKQTKHSIDIHHPFYIFESTNFGMRMIIYLHVQTMKDT